MIYRFYLKFIYGVVLVFFLFTANNAYAQKFYEGVLYPYNYYNLNPAYTGYENTTSLLLNYRSASTAISGMPEQIMFGIHSPIYDNMGLGLRIENYSEGLFNFLSGLIDYSYRVNIDKRQSLRFGVSIGYSANSIDNSKIVASDPMAILEIASENFTGVKFITAAGIVYKFQKIEFSLASPRLYVSSGNFNPVFSSAINYRFNLMNNQIKLTPFIYALYGKDLSFVYDVMLIADYKNKFQFGLGYRNRKAIILSTGINFSGFRINYAADIGVSKIASIYNVLHEVSITYGINNEKKTIQDSLFNPPLIVKSDTMQNKHTAADSLSIDNNLVITDSSTVHVVNKQFEKTDSLNIGIAEKNQIKESVVVEISTGIYIFNTDIDTTGLKENELDSLIKNMQLKSNEKEPQTEELSVGIYDIENIEKNTDINEIDSIIALMNILQNNEASELKEQDENFMDQYFTILVDINNSTDAMNKNIELLEDFDVKKDTYGRLLYTYGKFLTKDAAEKSATNLKNKGFKILKITQIGKLWFISENLL